MAPAMSTSTSRLGRGDTTSATNIDDPLLVRTIYVDTTKRINSRRSGSCRPTYRLGDGEYVGYQHFTTEHCYEKGDIIAASPIINNWPPRFNHGAHTSNDTLTQILTWAIGNCEHLLTDPTKVDITYETVTNEQHHVLTPDDIHAAHEAHIRFHNLEPEDTQQDEHRWWPHVV